MELSMIAVIVVVTILSLHFVVIPKFFRRKKLNFPPGPKPWPVIGNIDLLGPLPHCDFADLSKKYGPIMQVKVGPYPMVVATSSEAAKIFLKTMDLDFASRPKRSVGKYTGYNYSNIVWAPYGPYFNQARKLCLTELFSPKRLASFEYIRAEERNSMLKEVFESAGKPIPLKSILLTLSSNVLSRMVLGKKYFDVAGGNAAVVSPAEFKWMLEELFFLNGIVNIGDFIPWLNFLDLQGYVRRMKAVSKKMDRFLEHVLAEHEARRRRETAAESRDLVDVLLELAEDPNLEVKIERNGVKAFAQDMLAAGTDSTAAVVECAIAELFKNPEFFKKATEELDRVIGQERWVEETDLPNLRYIDAIVKETMRLHPICTILIPRVARKDLQVAGYDIKKGTEVLIDAWAIHMEPSIWENPNEFNPERFIANDINIKGQDFRLLPFGSGRRMCPGYALGLKVVQTALANLLHGFTWKLPDDTKPGDFNNVDEVFVPASQRRLLLLVVAESRLPLHLYDSL